ncbi:hypothetical protein [Micromonospora sp. CB01531]|uniref:hypothetical protein n=1 Tax=Micromonospora sp. CB01531 TaxID=1718947 RepID=UPI000A6A1590|nr:hypothetical protein [Micromonospora sp. CB01531]
MAREYVTEDGHRYKSLSDLMEFDHVIQVREDGTISDNLPNIRELWAPEVTWSDGTHHVDGEGWSLLNGYSGQYGYSGPVMHPSELIGGRMEQDIISQPGYYVAVVVSDVDECQAHCPEDCDGNHDDAGWAVAYREGI